MLVICRNFWGSSTYTSSAIYQYLLMLGGQTIGENVANPSFDEMFQSDSKTYKLLHIKDMYASLNCS